MLHLLYGPAASGKTDLLMGRIRTAVAARTPGQVLLVPEQYSHEAERALCAACGDSLSLYAEVLSFTGLAQLFLILLRRSQLLIIQIRQQL